MSIADARRGAPARRNGRLGVPAAGSAAARWGWGSRLCRCSLCRRQHPCARNVPQRGRRGASQTCRACRRHLQASRESRRTASGGAPWSCTAPWRSPGPREKKLERMRRELATRKEGEDMALRAAHVHRMHRHHGGHHLTLGAKPNLCVSAEMDVTPGTERSKSGKSKPASRIKGTLK